jgi:hypothetical protein
MSNKTQDLIKKKIKDASEAHAKITLGESQFKSNKSARESIQEDFSSGANWMLHYNNDFSEENKTENLEELTTKNLEMVSSFAEHYKAETGKEIEESTILSFFNA